MRVTTTDESAETRRLNIEDVPPMGEGLLDEELRLATGGIRSTFIGTYCHDGDGQYLCDYYDGF